MRFPRLTIALLLVIAATAAAPPLAATSVVPPKNLGRLARISSAVVLARATGSFVEDRGLPFTITTFELVEPVGGARLRAVFEVEVPGGELADTAAWVAGAPRFVRGRNYLLFLGRAGGGRWRPQMLAYGVLEEVGGKGLLRPLEAARQIDVFGDAEELAVYREAELIAHLREVIAGAPWDRRKVVAREASIAAKLHTKPAACMFQTDAGDGRPLRNFGYETGATMSIVHTTPGQTGIADGGVAAVQQGVAAWTDHPDSVIRYLYGGSRPRNIACGAGSDLDQGGVVFNDPCNDIQDLVGCQGTLAFGGSFYNPAASPLHDGEPWHDVTAAFVVVNNGTQCVGEVGFREMMTHELGHTQGFGHHTDGNATMSATLKNDGRGASLATTDRQCASYAYHTFLDVPYDFWAWRQIEAVENAGITGGCRAGTYCPGAVVSRAQMAIFLVRAQSGGSYTPPPCTTPMFADVPCSNPASPWINELARRRITLGCGGGNYCPNAAVTREQMAIFLLRTISGPDYVPPPCTVPMFVDVPCTRSSAPWVNELARRGITSGCAPGLFCPTNAVKRDEMAVFLARALALPLPP